MRRHISARWLLRLLLVLASGGCSSVSAGSVDAPLSVDEPCANRGALVGSTVVVRVEPEDRAPRWIPERAAVRGTIVA